jgi:hypothetical protein
LATVAYVAFVARGCERARRPLVCCHPVDMDTVDVVARLWLSARRAGLELVVHDPCPLLEALLGLAGFAAVLAEPPGPNDSDGSRPTQSR